MQVGRAWKAEIGNPTLGDSYTHAWHSLFLRQLKMADGRWMFCMLLVVWSGSQDKRTRMFFFRCKKAEGAKCVAPRSSLDPLCPEEATLCWWLVVCSPHQCFGLFDSWLHAALEHYRRSCTSSTSETRLKVENPDSDLQRNCLDWRTYKVLWFD